MEIKLRKQRCMSVYDGLNYDRFAVLQTEEKIIDMGEVGYIDEDSVPTSPKTVSDWKTQTKTIKIRERDWGNS